MNYRKIRFDITTTIGQPIIKYRKIRFGITVDYGKTYIYRKIRIPIGITIGEKTSGKYRKVRFNVTTTIDKYVPIWNIPEEDDNPYFPINLIIGSGTNITPDMLYANGIGSYTYYDFKFIDLNNRKINIMPGFFYFKNKEYYYLGDSTITETFTGNTILSFNINYIRNNYKYIEWINQPFIFTTGTFNSAQSYVETYNPANSGCSLRHIVNLSGIADTLDGLSDYSFNLPQDGFYIDQSGTSYNIYFHETNTGTKTFIYNSGYISINIPSLLTYPGYITKFVILSDSKIIISPDSLNVYVPKKQYVIGESIPYIIVMKGLFGEFCPNYPLLVNGTGILTDEFGTYSGTFIGPSLPISTSGTPDPEIYHAGSYVVSKVYYVEMEGRYVED